MYKGSYITKLVPAHMPPPREIVMTELTKRGGVHVTVVQCRRVAQPDHALVMTGHNDTRQEHVYNDLMRFSCEDGYELEGHVLLRCEESGRWSGLPPTCQGTKSCTPLILADMETSSYLHL